MESDIEHLTKTLRAQGTPEHVIEIMSVFYKDYSNWMIKAKSSQISPDEVRFTLIHMMAIIIFDASLQIRVHGEDNEPLPHIEWSRYFISELAGMVGAITQEYDAYIASRGRTQ